MKLIITSLIDELPPIRRQSIVLTHATLSIGAQGNIAIIALPFSQYKILVQGNMGNLSI